MISEFFNIFSKSLKLDKSLYKDNKNFGEEAIYFAGLIMILDGVAGAVAANSVVKTSIGMLTGKLFSKFTRVTLPLSQEDQKTMLIH